LKVNKENIYIILTSVKNLYLGVNIMFWVGKTRTGKIIGLIACIFVGALGLSGEFVLLGTNSSVALVVAAGIFGVMNIIGLITHKDEDGVEEATGQILAAEKQLYERKSLKFEQQIIDTLDSSPSLSVTHNITIVPAYVLSENEVYAFALNGSPVGELSNNSSSLVITTDKIKNVISVADSNNANYLFCFFEADESEERNNDKITFFPAKSIGKEFVFNTSGLKELPNPVELNPEEQLVLNNQFNQPAQIAEASPEENLKHSLLFITKRSFFPNKKKKTTIILWFISYFGMFPFYSLYLKMWMVAVIKVIMFVLGMVFIISAGEAGAMIGSLILMAILIWGVVDVIKIAKLKQYESGIYPKK